MKTNKNKSGKKPKAPIGVCTCQVGPYRGYFGLAHYDADDGCFTGSLLGINDVITFVGDTPEEVAIAFQDSVDDYLEHCANRGKEPNKPFSGKFMVRVAPELHRQLSMAAESRSVSLNALLTDIIATGVGGKQCR
jgi:predicted HicB family RNase H-like nuclease